MELLLISFFAGVLTILAPCVLPILPIILGHGSEGGRKKSILIIASLAISVLIFSLLLKATTLFISVPNSVWTFVSGGIILGFGIFTLFPNLWTRISYFIGFEQRSHGALEIANKKEGTLGTILLGMSLGPVFTSCSPTFGLILAVVLPQSFAFGFVNLVFYVLGLSSVLFLISVLGQKVVGKFRGFADPNGIFKKILGLLFVIIGIFIIFGIDKIIEGNLAGSGFVEGLINFEQSFLDKIKK